MKKVSILGSTGSIGAQALKVVERYPDRVKVVGLAASTSIDVLAEQVKRHKPAVVSVKGEEEAAGLARLLDGTGEQPEIVHGSDGLIRAATHAEADSILNSLVGSIGLAPTLAALRTNREVLLANKESLVMAGEIIRDLLDSGKGRLVPIDSEHSAIMQCLHGRVGHPGLRKIILTASGGPFRNRPTEDFDKITVEEALSHPTWKMGRKVTIDSATLMNKGLEIIEARYLFGLEPENIEVVIHPPSIVHSLVEFKDGSLLAQLSNPTMEVPIQYALLDGDRAETTVSELNLANVGCLEFYEPDHARFPALDLARKALRLGGTAPAVLNGANEAAVSLFLARRIPFTSICRMVGEALEAHRVVKATENAVFAADLWAREHVKSQTADIIDIIK